MQKRAKNKSNNDIRFTSLSSHRMTSKSLMGMMFYWTLMAGIMLCHQLPIASATYKDDPCTTKSKPGLCKEWSECAVIKTLIERGEYTNREVVSCGFDVRQELICCPVITTDTKIEVTSPPPTKPSTGPMPTERAAVRACQRIQKGIYNSLTPHIIDGTPAELGEFPHMVAIGYSRLGDDGQGPYDIRCGGTLIDERYVLTAAHCVSSRDSVPAIARMGVVDFKDPNAMEDAVEIKIKETFIHNDYKPSRSYNDIAILELERPAPLGNNIHPVCLYTDPGDPKPEERLLVTGWGTINTTSRVHSDILLKAELRITPLERCNASFVDYGLVRQIGQGIIETQLCAEDKAQRKDACQGDSGGPLNFVVDESKKDFRLLGVVSTGFGCANSTPGLYTRVAAFLDFIERICWPNGGA